MFHWYPSPLVASVQVSFSFTGLTCPYTDAYAMTEVYFLSMAGLLFDPIPGHPLIPPSIEENQTLAF